MSKERKQTHKHAKNKQINFEGKKYKQNAARIKKKKFEQNRGFNFGQQKRNKLNESKGYQSRFNNDQNYHQYDQATEFQGRSFGNRGQRRSPDRNRGRAWGRGRGVEVVVVVVALGIIIVKGTATIETVGNDGSKKKSQLMQFSVCLWDRKELDKELEKYYTGGGNDGKERTEQMLDDELKDYYKVQQDNENVATNSTQNDKDTDAHVNTNTNTNTDQQDKK
ncbi:hypothetical protein RFI_07567 [Reticulomyxa filosa]|uniref:Uncharacterized protein n=1 Tax=Reticulomyxa filosa TaxID=46433 RepID=X6NUT3_RETFI|nr:hypothetical protein RFI_07567 [Reticulomyxa filosa]|eukprot:ETO29554.1 hypothetical protein RFI_07567 [Reticulomyxa filosa]